MDVPGKPIEAVLFFDNSDLPLVSCDLVDFLRLFRAAYIFGMNFRNVAPESITPEWRSEFISILQSFGTDGGFEELISVDLENEELLFTKISKNSPLEIVTSCVIPALAVAVIVSGGKVDLLKLRFELPPLGEGIRKLLEAFGFQVNKAQQIRNLRTQLKYRASTSATKEQKETSLESRLKAKRARNQTFEKPLVEQKNS